MKFLNRLAKGMLLLAILVSAFGLTAIFTGQKVEAYTAALATVMPGDLSVLDLKLRGSDILDTNGVTRVTVGATNTVTGNLTVTGTLTNGSMSAMATPPAVQTLGAGATIAADGCGTLKRLACTTDRTTSTTDTFTAPAAGNTGCFMFVVNTSTNVITLDSNTNFKSVGGADVALAAGNILGVASDGTYWYQVTAQLDD
jgi:hypothetical protein